MPVILSQVNGTHHPEVWAALQREYPRFGLWAIDPGDEYEYGNSIRAWWEGKWDLVLVEQDVVVPPGSIAELLDCPAEWCSHPVWLGDHYSERTLGLVKFSRDLQERFPDLAASALPGAWTGRPCVHWRSVDSALIRCLDFARVPVHVHQPPAQHLHRYPGSPPAGPAPATPGRPA